MQTPDPKWGSITPGKADARKDSLSCSLHTTDSPECYLLYQVKSRTTQHQMPSCKKKKSLTLFEDIMQRWRGGEHPCLSEFMLIMHGELESCLHSLNLDGFLSQSADPSSPQQAPSWVAFWFCPVIHSSRELYAQGHCSQTDRQRQVDCVKLVCL